MQDARRSAESAQNDRRTNAKRAFLRRLCRHLDDGTRPEGEERLPWASAEFVTRIEKLIHRDRDRSTVRQKACDLRTVQSWRRHDDAGQIPVLPQSRFVPLIIRALFGDANTDCEDANELRNLHVKAASRFQPREQDPEEREQQCPSANFLSVGWKIEPGPDHRPIAELIIHDPPLSNAPNTLALHASVSLGSHDVRIDSYDVIIRLGGSTLAANYAGCEWEQGSRLGEFVEHPLVQFDGGFWRLPGRDAKNPLTGTPLGQARLGLMVLREAEQPFVTLELRSDDRQLDVTLRGGKRPATKLREKLVKAYLQKKLPKENGEMIVWARSTLRRRS
jgi:hypothetical protein